MLPSFLLEWVIPFQRNRNRLLVQYYRWCHCLNAHKYSINLWSFSIGPGKGRIMSGHCWISAKSKIWLNVSTTISYLCLIRGSWVIGLGSKSNELLYHENQSNTMWCDVIFWTSRQSRIDMMRGRSQNLILEYKLL